MKFHLILSQKTEVECIQDWQSLSRNPLMFMLSLSAYVIVCFMIFSIEITQNLGEMPGTEHLGEEGANRQSSMDLCFFFFFTQENPIDFMGRSVVSG